MTMLSLANTLLKKSHWNDVLTEHSMIQVKLHHICVMMSQKIALILIIILDFGELIALRIENCILSLLHNLLFSRFTKA